MNIEHLTCLQKHVAEMLSLAVALGHKNGCPETIASLERTADALLQLVREEKQLIKRYREQEQLIKRYREQESRKK